MEVHAAVEGFADALADFSPETRKTYLRSARAFLRATGLAPEEVTADDVRRHLRELADGGMTEGAVAVRLCALRFFFAWLARERRIAASPVDAVPGPRVLWGAAERLSPEVIAALYDRRTYRGKTRWRDRAVVLLLLRAGLRVRELIALDWADVDTEKGLLRVRSWRHHPGRTVQLDDDTFEAVLEHWIRAEDVAPVFLGARSLARMSGHTATAIVRRVGAAAGHPALDPLKLRTEYLRAQGSSAA